MVTRRIDGQPAASAWRDQQWLTRLDVVLATLYFQVIASFLNQSPATPSAWDALFEARHATGIDCIQFALAGLNAHINHDLALALNQTDSELNFNPGPASPEHIDFEAVNAILQAALPDALTFLATGVLGVIAQDTGKIGRFLAIWDVRWLEMLRGILRRICAICRGHCESQRWSLRTSLPALSDAACSCQLDSGPRKQKTDPLQKPKDAAPSSYGAPAIHFV